MRRKHMVWSIAISGIILGHVLGGRVEAGERRYYLTKGTVVGNAALAACHEGDRMASLWEIFNMSTRAYDGRRGLTLADSGGGPPTAQSGWIRTGNVEGLDSSHDSGNIAGKANCKAWTTGANDTNGTAVSLFDGWIGTVIDVRSIILPWVGGTVSCDTSLPVWCVDDHD